MSGTEQEPVGRTYIRVWFDFGPDIRLAKRFESDTAGTEAAAFVNENHHLNPVVIQHVDSECVLYSEFDHHV